MCVCNREIRTVPIGKFLLIKDAPYKASATVCDST